MNVSFFAAFQRAWQRATSLSARSFFSLQVFGFAFIRAWVYLMFLGSAVSSMTWTGQAIPSFCYLISTLSLSITLFVSAYNQKWFIFFMEKKPVRAVVVAGTSIGTLMLASAITDSAPISMLLGSVGALATGIGSGFIDLGYGEIYRNLPLNKTGVEVPFAFLLAAFLFALTMFLPPVLACIVCAALPLLSGVILFHSLEIFTPAMRSRVRPANISTRRFSLRIGMCACLVGIADGVVRAAFIETKGIDLTSFYQWPLVGGAIATLIIIYVCLAFSESDAMRSIYRSVMLILSFFFMLLPVFVDLSWLESIIALTGFGTFNVLIWILLAEVSNRYRLSSLTVFGIGWGMVTVGVLLGSLAADWVLQFAPFSPQALSLIALAATTCIMFSYMFVFKESDLIELTKDEDNSQHSDHTATGADIEGDKRPGLQERCQEIAEQYGISPKELEVMTLFAKGRTAARIQEELFISKGTVSTHLRHIYQKLDVHSKQEMIDLIEGR